MSERAITEPSANALAQDWRTASSRELDDRYVSLFGAMVVLGIGRVAVLEAVAAR